MRPMARLSLAAVDSTFNQWVLLVPVAGPIVQTVEMGAFRFFLQHYNMRRHLKFCNAVKIGPVVDAVLIVVGIALKCFSVQYPYLFMARAFIIGGIVSVFMRMFNHKIGENLYFRLMQGI